MSSLAQFSPEYLNEYIGDKLICTAGIFIALESFFVALRCYARTLTASAIGWDDRIIPVAWLANVGLCILGITFVQDTGVGRHQAAVWSHYNSEKAVSWGKSLYALEWLYLTAVALPKISILCVYLRIFTNRAARSGCYILIGIIAANWTAFILVSTFECFPPAYKWDKTIADGRCLNLDTIAKATSAPNIATDIVVLILPMSTVRRLNASSIRKLGLMVVFLAGSVGIIASCARMATYWKPNAFADLTWASVSLVGWSIIECGMYLIAASLLTLRPIFAQISHRWPRIHLKRFGFRKVNFSSSGGDGDYSLQHLPPTRPRFAATDIHYTEDDEPNLVRHGIPHNPSATGPQVPQYDEEQRLGVPIKPFRILVRK